MATLRTPSAVIKLTAFTLIALFVGSGNPVHAAGGSSLLEVGDGYWIVQDCAGCRVGPDGVGAVIVLYEIVDLPNTTRVFAVRSTILDVLVFEEGWTSQVKKDGGIDASIEVVFENPTCFVKFKSKVEPGKTKIDHGAVKCK